MLLDTHVVRYLHMEMGFSLSHLSGSLKFSHHASRNGHRKEEEKEAMFWTPINLSIVF